MKAPEISVIIPAFNEAERIKGTLDGCCSYLRPRFPSFEVIVADDGSRDETAEVVERVARQAPVKLAVLGTNQGKGAAVRHGLWHSRGSLVLMMDADLATPMQELDKLQLALAAGADVAIGSRGSPTSAVRRSQGPIRENMGKTFNRLVRTVLLEGFHDTQCGFKLFRRPAAEAIFLRAHTDGFAFDVEVLRIALALGFWVTEVPIEWYHDPKSHVSIPLDSLDMLLDLLRLRFRFTKTSPLARRAPR